MPYQVKDWDKHFENAKSRTYDHCSYVSVPNKQHGMGFLTIINEPDGAAIMGIWIMLLQALSQQGRPRGGWLTDGGYQADREWTPQDLAMRWRRQVEEVERAIDVLTSDRVGWLGGSITTVDVADKTTVSLQYPRSILAVPTRAREKKRNELNRTEQKDIVPAASADVEDSVKDFEVVLDSDKPRRGLRATKKVRDPRIDHPAIRMLKGIMGRYPDKIIWDEMIEIVGDSPNPKALNDCRKEWVRRGYNPNSTDWVTWTVNGIPDDRPARNGNGKAGKVSKIIEDGSIAYQRALEREQAEENAAK